MSTAKTVCLHFVRDDDEGIYSPLDDLPLTTLQTNRFHPHISHIPVGPVIPPTATMETMMEYVTSMAKSADEAGRKAIIDGLRDLAISLETPWESMQRIMYLV